MWGVQLELIDQGDDFVWCAGMYLLFAGAPGSKGDLLLIPIAIKCGAQDPNWAASCANGLLKG
jgi:hypothetical protein